MRYEVKVSAIEEKHVVRTIYVDAENENDARDQAFMEAEQTQDWNDAHYEVEYRGITVDEVIDENSPEFEGDDDEQDDEEDFPDPYIARDGRG